MIARYNIYLKAKKYAADGNFVKSFQLFEEVLEVNYDNSEVKFEYAKNLINALRFNDKNVEYEQKARTLLKSILPTRRNLIALLKLASLEKIIGNYVEAGQIFNQIIKNYKRRKDQTINEYEIYTYALSGMVVINTKLGDVKNAEIYLKELENTNYDKSSLLSLQVALKRRQKRYDEALLYCEKLEQNGQKKIGYWKAEIYIAQKKYEEALECLYNIQNLSPLNNQLKAYQLMISILLKLEKYDEAYSIYQNKLSSYSTNLKYNSSTELFIKYKLGLITSQNYKKNLYSNRIIFEYSLDDVLNHIQIGHNSDFYYDTKVLLNEATIKLKSEEHNVTLKNCVEEHEIIFNKPIGKAHGEETNTMHVVTYINDDKIITMYPFSQLKMEEKTFEVIRPRQKVKKQESRIERFNRMYRQNTN